MTEKTTVVIASTMRSGSTLLKALLAEADDVSNLPETNFQAFAGHPDAAEEISQLDKQPIVVLKRPCWYHEVKRYPQLPAIDGLKTILLVRDVYETVVSLRKMTYGKFDGALGWLANGFLARSYWAGVTERLLDISDREDVDTMLVRYEDLVDDPVPTTRRLFEFLESKQTSGVDSYSEPDDFEWQWGQDDGGKKIESLEVQPPKPHGYPNRRLVKTIVNAPKVMALRERIGYEPAPWVD